MQCQKLTAAAAAVRPCVTNSAPPPDTPCHACSGPPTPWVDVITAFASSAIGRALFSRQILEQVKGKK